MRDRVKELQKDDLVVGSSNFGRYLKFLENDECGWIEKINDILY